MPRSNPAGAFIVSIPFSSGHGGKASGSKATAERRSVSIPFSSGHGGKDNDTSESLRYILFLSLFHQVMGVKGPWIIE